MEMRPMNGGSLKAAGYDERTRKLVIELTSGTFEYSGVSPEIWRRLASASSPWSYFRHTVAVAFVATRVWSTPPPRAPAGARLPPEGGDEPGRPVARHSTALRRVTAR